MIYNKRKNILQACLIQMPVYGSKNSSYAESIAELTGSYVFGQYSDKKIQDIKFQDLGKAVKLVIDDFETEIHAKSTNGKRLATIYVGGSTQTVMFQNYDKVIDALNSVTTAKKHGIVAGACLTYWKISELLSQYEGQNSVGYKILAEALKQPRRKLFAHLQNPSLAMNIPQSAITEKTTEWTAMNLTTLKYQDMFEAGIIDSIQVCRNVIIDSVSLASQFINLNTSLIRADKRYNYTKQQYKQLSSKYKM